MQKILDFFGNVAERLILDLGLGHSAADLRDYHFRQCGYDSPDVLRRIAGQHGMDRIVRAIIDPGADHAQSWARQGNLGEDDLLAFQVEIEGIQKPYYLDDKHPLVRYLITAARKTKIRPAIKGSEGATVITFFQDKHIPAVAWGFGARNCAHIADEYIRIEDLYRGTLALERFLKGYKFEKQPNFRALWFLDENISYLETGKMNKNYYYPAVGFIAHIEKC